MATKSTKSRKKVKVNVPKGQAHILSTFNNTIVTLTDPDGNVLAWSSSGSSGFKGTRKSTSFAAQSAGSHAAEKAKPYGLTKIEVFVSGVGSGRESAIRALQHAGLNVTSIKDVTPMPHNGVRPRKPKRQ